jgi:exportin-1
MLKPMKTLRRDILRLIQTFIEKASEFTIFNEEFLPTLKTLVDDFQNSDPYARDPEVLLLFATMFKRMGELLSGFLTQILINLCDTTLSMIKNDYLSFPEFRESFFTLVEKIIKHCTAGLFSLNLSQFQTFILTILFAMKHEKPEAMDIGLNTMHALNTLVA